MHWSYRNRQEAGELLAQKLLELKGIENPLVLAIPNGGIAVAAPIAQALQAELDLIIVRKLQIPYNPEAGFGALTSFGNVILNEQLVTSIGLSNDEIQAVINNTQAQITERKQAYAGLVGHSNPTNQNVIVVDDGLASGYTMLAAVQSLSDLKPLSIIVAVPTASNRAYELVIQAVDQLICPRVETGFVFAVADAYQNWYDVPDSEVIEHLKRFKPK